MKKINSLLGACSEYTMEDLEKLTFTKIVKASEEKEEFMGLGIMDENGYLLEYQELKQIYYGLNYFIRKTSPELIEQMNHYKHIEDQKQKEKAEIIEIVSKNIVHKENLESEGDPQYDEEYHEEHVSFLKRLFGRKKTPPSSL